MIKWIGQHIWDFVSRVRNDVYLEAVATGTIASGGNLGLDSNNKIVKANEASGGLTTSPWSATQIKILPHQFQINDDAGRPIFVEDDTSNTLGVRCFGTTDEMYAWQTIPDGYKVTHVQVYASSTVVNGVKVRSYNLISGADNNVAETSGATNASIAITEIPAGLNQDLVIKVVPQSSSVIVFGAIVTIATV